MAEGDRATAVARGRMPFAVCMLIPGTDFTAGTARRAPADRPKAIKPGAHGVFTEKCCHLNVPTAQANLAGGFMPRKEVAVFKQDFRPEGTTHSLL